MSLTLDPQTEQRLQQELSRGNYAEPADLINHALDLVNADQYLNAEEKSHFDDFLDERMAEYTRGEGISGERAREILAQEGAARIA